MSEPALVSFQMHQAAFSFLGIENIVTESSDFGYFWDHFFKAGGYEKIIPYATDIKPINIWYTNKSGQEIFFQGLMVDSVGNVPEGYTLAQFPASDFIVVTHEWLPTNEAALEYGIGAGWKHEKTVQMPDGYVRYDGPGSPITIIEKENSDTPDGSRYEVWVPIRKIDNV